MVAVNALELEMLMTLANGPETSATVHPDLSRSPEHFSTRARELDRGGLEAIYEKLLELGFASASYEDHDGFEPAPPGQKVAWYSLTTAGVNLLKANGLW